jgi:hypothetical protein
MAGAFYMASSVVNYLAFGNAVTGNVLTDFATQTGACMPGIRVWAVGCNPLQLIDTGTG